MMKTKNQKGQAMREARRRLGFTQLELAQRAGCTESQITKIETGRITPETWLKEAIASQLNIPTWAVGAVGHSTALPGKSNETNYTHGN